MLSKSSLHSSARLVCSVFIPHQRLIFSFPIADIRRYTLSEGIGHLVMLYRSPDEAAYRSPVLAGLAGIIMAVSRASLDSAISVDEDLLGPYKDDVLGAFTSGMKASQTRRPALEGILHLIRVPACMTSDELGFVTHNMNQLIAESSEDLEELRFVLSCFASSVDPPHPMSLPQANAAEYTRCYFRREREGT